VGEVVEALGSNDPCPRAGRKQSEKIRQGNGRQRSTQGLRKNLATEETAACKLTVCRPPLDQKAVQYPHAATTGISANDLAAMRRYPIS